MRSYNKEHCWQYEVRIQNKEQDLELATQALSCSKSELQNLKVGDFVLSHEDKEKSFQEAKEFIQHNEWLGKMSLYPTHIFTARYKGLLCGVVVMDMPIAFSKLLGEDTRKIERLISRGACISFSPKNLASALIMFSINWMVKNTDYRLFTAYADTEAKELGTIYQACNFYYLGKKSGTSYQFKLESGKWVSDRYFRSRSFYKRTAKTLGIAWNPSWQKGDKILFNKMPQEVENLLRAESKKRMNQHEKRKVKAKHKYAYVLGSTKAETKKLRNLFMNKNKTFPYPKNRGQ